ncbi:phage tail tube protein [Comamonas sp. GB3 AK4-5]|uniref:phage tail tube protein n=1 Tax=Comamonas sp. GB3 AK4-5 TaxID=3231487 RepID=UPI00351DFA0C
MALLTQGTEVYALVPKKDDPTQLEVIVIDDATEFDPGADSADDIETTPLSARKSRTYLPGLETPAEATLTIQADPRVPSHVRLYELRNVPLQWAVGWSDGTEPPTAPATSGDGKLVLPKTRTWFIFDGHVKTFPFNLEGNSVVKSTITIRRSGESDWVRKEQ